LAYGLIQPGRETSTRQQSPDTEDADGIEAEHDDATPAHEDTFCLAQDLVRMPAQLNGMRQEQTVYCLARHRQAFRPGHETNVRAGLAIARRPASGCRIGEKSLRIAPRAHLQELRAEHAPELRGDGFPLRLLKALADRGSKPLPDGIVTGRHGHRIPGHGPIGKA
jgi:hypothetical protein